MLAALAVLLTVQLAMEAAAAVQQGQTALALMALKAER
jgi:hypothetical protein